MKLFKETDRFILREILPEDADGMFELDSDPDVHRYLGNKPLTNKEQAVDIIRFIRRQYTENGIGRWAIIDKNTHEFIGWTGLKYVTELTNKHQNYYDLGYRLRKQYWGQGIATETAIASLEYAFESLNLDKVYAAASCENEASNKILRKIGFQLIETFYYEDILCNWYKMDKLQYENR